MAVALADLTIAAVDQELAALVLRDLATALYCFTLGIESLSHPRVALTTHGPLTVVRDHMLILAGH